VIRKFSDPPLDVCPKCGGGPVAKLLSSPAFQFKGSGWYITDYARKGQGKDGEAAGGGGTDKDSNKDKDKDKDKDKSGEAKESKPAAETSTPAPSTPPPASPKRE
jgi:predicted nucleic acid-binding Zn ribbon protein